MSGYEAHKMLEHVAITSSKNEKQALVKKYLNDETFAKAVWYAQNPFITFGVKKLPEHRTGSGDITADHWTLLDQLAKRELTGQAALDAIQVALEKLEMDPAELYRRVILKDLRAGFSRSTVNKAKPGFVPSFECMLAHKYEEKRIKKWPVAVEPKIDGVRVLAFITDDEVKFFSRAGKEFTTFNHLIKPLLALGAQLKGDIVVDGEVVSGNFNKTSGDVRRKDEQATDAKFCAFDILSTKLFEAPKGNETDASYSDRRFALEETINAVNHDRVIYLPQNLAYSHDEVLALYTQYRSEGHEGAVVKPLEGRYQRKRSHNWLKIKDAMTVDVRVVGMFEGTGKYVGMAGGVVVDYNGVEVRVGGGLSDSQRQDFWRLKEEVIGRLIEVEAHEETPDGSLRHPRFVRFRDDKDTE